jgi:hypothetical protein
MFMVRGTANQGFGATMMCKCFDNPSNAIDLQQFNWVLLQFSLLSRCAILRDRFEHDGVG